VGVFELLFLIVFWSWALTAALFLRNTWLPRLPLLDTPAQHGLPSETVRFHATDGLPLEGWKIAEDPSRPWILLCHGVGSNRSDLLEIVEGLYQSGYNLFLFDFRGHGGSSGRVTSFGWREQRDLEGALAFLGHQPDIPAKPYGVYGISLGGAVAMMVAARDERIGAVAADSPYISLDDTLKRHLLLMYRLPAIPFLWFIRLIYRLRFGVWPTKISPLISIAKLSPRSVLLIQGDQDVRTPLEDARKLLDLAGEPKELWVVEGAEHLAAFGINPAAYLQRLSAFFKANL